MSVINDQVISMIIYSSMKKYLYIDFVITSYDYRGRGYSRNLFNWLIKYSDKNMILYVLANNTIAKKFYVSLGFKYLSYEDQVYKMILKASA
jgi:ribosomal protein S18 acetylase RimI-like enzyme